MAFVPRLLVGLVACGLLGCAARHPGGVDDFRRLLAAGEPAPRDLVLTFFEVGIGDAILVEFPSGRTLLVDAGIGWRADHILNYLAARGIEGLDGLLLTHPHLDHYGGMERIVQAVPVGTFYHNGARSGSHRLERLDEALALHGVARRVVRRGDRMDDLAGEGATIEVLYPDAEAMAGGGGHNRGSIVLRIVHGSRRFLLTGDAERNEEKRLLALEGEALAHDVLKLGHHASPFSGTSAFLEAVRPRLAIAQGTEVINFPPFYPRPTPRIRRVLDREGARLLTVAREGAIQVLSDGKTICCRTMAGLGKATPPRFCSMPGVAVPCSLAAASP
jgi:beta-lactamase superfamily II metal-dependent hydrolase